MYSLNDTLSSATHSVTYWVPFWDEPIVARCACEMSEDHVEVTPIPGAEAASAFVQRIGAWFRREPRQ